MLHRPLAPAVNPGLQSPGNGSCQFDRALSTPLSRPADLRLPR